MKSIPYNVSEIASVLSNMLKAHKLVFTQAYEKYSLALQYSRVEQGLYYINLKINSIEDIAFVQMAEDSNDWTMIYYLEKDAMISKKAYKSGVYTGFSDREMSFCCKSDKETCLHILLLHKDFTTIYKYNTIFDFIRQKQNNFYYQPLSQQITDLFECISERSGLIKTKQNIIELLNIFHFKTADIETCLRMEIKSFCEICLKNDLNISSFLSKKFNCDSQIFQKFFLEKFGTDIQSYFYDYKINNAKKYLRLEKDALNAILLENLNKHLPHLKQFEVQLGLSIKVFKILFFEEFGESIFDYYLKLRLSVAKNSLLKEKKKVYQVSQHLGYSHPSDLIQFFNRHEGITPKQMVLRQKETSNYTNISNGTSNL